MLSDDQIFQSPAETNEDNTSVYPEEKEFIVTDNLKNFRLLEAQHNSHEDIEESWEEELNCRVNETLSVITSKVLHVKKQYEEIKQMKNLVIKCHEELNEKELRLEKDYKQKLEDFEDEKKKMKEMNAINESIITLNVGGAIFTTSKTTLLADENSMLAAMFSGIHQLTTTKDGAYFIDADGTYFQTILNYLRGKIKYINDLPSSREILNKLKIESDFYQITGLKEMINIALDKNTQLTLKWIEKNYEFNSQPDFERDMNFTSFNLDGISFSLQSFSFHANFENASLVGAKFRKCLVKNSIELIFDNADLQGCDFRGSTLSTRTGYSSMNHSILNIGNISFKDVKNINLAFFDDGILEWIKTKFNLWKKRVVQYETKL